MPHERIEKLTLYYFDELSPAAKEKAREEFREGNMDYDWWENTYADVAQCAAILGIEINTRYDKNPKGETVPRGPEILFSGFWSQGDGACFEGTYSWAKGCAKAIKKYAPKDEELHRIGRELSSLQRKLNRSAVATMRHSGHYYHSGCMSVDVSSDWDKAQDYVPGGWEDQLTKLMRDFANWIYRQLETEYDWLNADEQVDEAIMANEYEFTEDGRRA